MLSKQAAYRLPYVVVGHPSNVHCALTTRAGVRAHSSCVAYTYVVFAVCPYRAIYHDLFYARPKRPPELYLADKGIEHFLLTHPTRS